MGKEVLVLASQDQRIAAGLGKNYSVNREFSEGDSAVIQLHNILGGLGDLPLSENLNTEGEGFVRLARGADDEWKILKNEWEPVRNDSSMNPIEVHLVVYDFCPFAEKNPLDGCHRDIVLQFVPTVKG